VRNHLILIAVIVIWSSAGVVSAGEAETADSRQDQLYSGHYWGAAAQVSAPRGAFKDDFSTGYGLQGVVDYPLIPLLDLTGSLGWNHFPGVGDGGGADIWEITFGARFVLGSFFMNGEMGYFSQVDEGNFIPGLGFRSDHWELSVRTKAAGSNAWSSFRLVRFF